MSAAEVGLDLTGTRQGGLSLALVETLHPFALAFAGPGFKGGVKGLKCLRRLLRHGISQGRQGDDFRVNESKAHVLPLCIQSDLRMKGGKC